MDSQTKPLFRLTQEQLKQAVINEGQEFERCYRWLEESMPESFFREVTLEQTMLITHNLMGFHLQGYFSKIHLKRAEIVLCLDSPDATLRILEQYEYYGIKNYRTFISKQPPPYPDVNENIRIAILYFTEAIETIDLDYPNVEKEELREHIQIRNPSLSDQDFDQLISEMNRRFLVSLPTNRLVLALDMYFQAQTQDCCQYELRYNENWQDQTEGEPSSIEIILAWKNTPKHHFLYRLARVIHRHGLVMNRVNATYINPHEDNTTLLLALGLHGSQGEAAWDVADLPAFIRSLVTVKYFASFDLIDQRLVEYNRISDVGANLLRCMVNFIHQCLLHLDPNEYSLRHIEKDLCAHPEITEKICRAFELKFDPSRADLDRYTEMKSEIMKDIETLDTGHEERDLRRKNVLKLAISFIHFTLKTNIYLYNYPSISFRIDPLILNELPFDRRSKFPELPHAIFFVKGMHFFGFHIRFKDLSRGGLRTIYPSFDAANRESKNVFLECYNLALTQHKKNKDIPEGGAKGVILLNPYHRLRTESEVVQKELQRSGLLPSQIRDRMQVFNQRQKKDALYQAQRSFIEGLLPIVNCNEDGTLKVDHCIDYWKKPEYLYLGPDENMHPSMIEWISEISKEAGYKPGSSFITSKPKNGINHKEYGVTSKGVHVYLQQTLKFLNIDPNHDPFTIKMSGGPDGDVAGNELMNLASDYPKTAKVISITDGTGTIHDPKGLDFNHLKSLFKQELGIRHYPPDALHEGGFLLDVETTQTPQEFVTQTLCWKKNKGKVQQYWLSGSEMNGIYHHHLHQVVADVFIPAGGRPRTLNEGNWREFLDRQGTPTSKAIIEGANLYLTEEARRLLEEHGALIIKDSSANKTGVICSSFEVLGGLAMSDEEFTKNQSQIVSEILERIKDFAFKEANLLFRTHAETLDPLTQISDLLSERINTYTDQLQNYLIPQNLNDPNNRPLLNLFLEHCLPILRQKKGDPHLIDNIPDLHKKAIIATSLSTQIVYEKGLFWSPGILDILPTILFNSAD